MWFRPRSNQNDNERGGNRAQRLRDAHGKNASIDGEANDRFTVARSQSGRRLSQLLGDDANDIEREKTLRTDHRYKKNRVSKSASRTKIADQLVEKVAAAAAADMGGASAVNEKPRKLSIPTAADAKKSPAKAKSGRPNSNLNLNALLRYKSFIKGSTKKLTSDDFDRMRRKSLSEVNKALRKPADSSGGHQQAATTKPAAETYRTKRPSGHGHDENDNSFDHSDCDHVDYANGNVYFRPTAVIKTTRWFDTDISDAIRKDAKHKQRRKGCYHNSLCPRNRALLCHFFLFSASVRHINGVFPYKMCIIFEKIFCCRTWNTHCYLSPRICCAFLTQIHTYSCLNTILLIAITICLELFADRPSSASVVRQPSDRRADLNSSANSTTPNNHSITSESSTVHSIDIDTSVQDGAVCENRDR